MRNSNVIGSLALIASVFITFTITSSILAHQDGLNAGVPSEKSITPAVADNPQPEDRTKTSSNRNRSARDQANTVRKPSAQTPNSRTAIRLEDSSIVSQGNQVRIQAKVSIIESNLNSKYVWSIILYRIDANNEKTPKQFLSQHPYLHQQFSIINKDLTEQAFDDVIKLQPGAYKVEIVLYRSHQNLNLESLADSKIESNSRVIATTKNIFIPD